MHEQPVPVAEGVAVGFLRGGIGGGADVRDEKRRMDGARRLAQVAVVPGGVHAAVAKRRLGGPAFDGAAVPPQPESVPVRGGRAQARMQALFDERVLGLEQHALHLQGTTGISQPTAHDALLRSGQASVGARQGFLQARAAGPICSAAPSAWPCAPWGSWRPSRRLPGCARRPVPSPR